MAMTDDDVVEDIDIHHFSAFDQAAGQGAVFVARLCIPAGMIVAAYDG